MPGDPCNENQIVSSNVIGLHALINKHGGQPIDLGIARDDAESLLSLAKGALSCDLLITTGGASVGDHDLVKSVLANIGLEVDFWRIAMRPGKPLIFGKIGSIPLLGLPGNPVSSMVCYNFSSPCDCRDARLEIDDSIKQTCFAGLRFASQR